MPETDTVEDGAQEHAQEPHTRANVQIERSDIEDSNASPAQDKAPQVRPEAHQPAPWSAVRTTAGAIWRWLLIPYDRLPPKPRGWWERVAFALVILFAAIFAIYFIAYSGARFDAYITNAEDMGIMDQALWNTVHGSLLHQTICNSISDTNCLGNISRFAIHFEPLMLLLAPLYLFAASPKTLLVVQMVVVASGALPAYWIACRRLQSPLAGICFATTYLLFPALHGAVLFDFHAVTLSAAFLLFAFYFMLSGNNVGLIICCVLAMSTKEEMPLDIFMLGLAIFLLQRRWRLGAGVMALAVLWLGIAVVIMHFASPFGHSPTASRYAYLGSSPIAAGIYILTHPVQLLFQQILPNGGAFYLRTLLTPVGYLNIFSPLTAALALPALLINLLSSDPNMHTGLHQYSADIVPVMVFSAISGAALLVALAQRTSLVVQRRFGHVLARVHVTRAALWQRIRWRGNNPLSLLSPARVLLLALLALTMFLSVRQQFRLAYLPMAPAFQWPQVTQHNELGNHLITMIPPNASVSAQDTLVPHLSHRHFIYQYPYMAQDSDYVILDTAGRIYPFADYDAYYTSISALLKSGRFHIVVAEDGYLLLARNT